MSLQPFHLAITVTDLAKAREFYGGLLRCPEGRSSEEWVDFNLYGHQLVCHLDNADNQARTRKRVDDKHVPVPHFGVVLEQNEWELLADRLRDAGMEFILEPGVRFAGLPGEQATFFLTDPFGNALEFKALRDPGNLFSKQ